MPTSIEWTNETWNPVTGCTEVSHGCDRCYAKTFAERFRGTPGHHFENGFDLTLRPEAMSKPDQWKKPRMVFVNSMSDLFHRDVPNGFIAKVFDTMLSAERHTFQVLTKRPERMRRDLTRYYELIERGMGGERLSFVPYPNVWIGVSIESNDYAWRADMLRQTPAAVRFISVEPMLGPVDKVDLAGIDWVICGGESGHGARPMHPQWARDLRDRCVDSNTAFFLKQLGGARNKRANEAAILDGRRWTEFPKPMVTA